jgi:glycerol-3-phosphate dehydrogenase (NAD(P)+)
MTRLGLVLGARATTFMGLAALGDLVLTCTDNQSRNRRFGLALAEGLSAVQALERIGQVVEGYEAARAVLAVSRRHNVDMPIATAVEQVLHEGVSPADAARGLMERELRAEY